MTVTETGTAIWDIYTRRCLLCGICGNQTTLPMGQLPKSWNSSEGQTFLLWYFSLCIKLGWEGWITPIMLHYSLSQPNLLPSFYILSLSFTCFKLGRKTGQEELEGGLGQAFKAEKAAACIVRCWQLPAFLEHLQIPLPNADWYRKFHFVLLPNSISVMDFVIFLYLFPVLFLTPAPSPLKVVYL